MDDETARLAGAPDTDPPFVWQILQVWVNDESDDPIPNCFVQVYVYFYDWGGCVCDAAELEGYTDETGWVAIPLSFGGYGEGLWAGWIWAEEDIPIRHYEWVTSPDFNGCWGDCGVSLADFTFFCSVFCGSGEPYDACDYTGDGWVSIADFTYFAESYHLSCPPYPY